MMPAEPGTYVLVLRCNRARRIRVGSLGKMIFAPGYYLYVGSAFGPGGLRARIRHHRRRAANPHWHIDYLRVVTKLESVWYVCGERWEHEWAAALAALPGASVALSRFGSSDCACATHLYRFEAPVKPFPGAFVEPA